MLVGVIFFSCFAAIFCENCDSSKYKKIGCFQRQDSKLDTTISTGEPFDVDTYNEKLPGIVCSCFENTKNKYKYFGVGSLGHCFAGDAFTIEAPQSLNCVGPAEHHSGGLEEAEYVYQIKADAATPVDGNTTEWSEWSQCSKTCGRGKQSRERACVNPLPNDPGKGCEDLTEVKDCNVQECPIDGKLSSWGGWSQCSKSCGPGTKQRSRSCTDPKYGGKPCQGALEETQNCNNGNCIGQSKHVTTCEGSKCSLNCPSNWKIKLEYYNYGRTDKTTCTDWYNIHWSTNCKSDKNYKIKDSCEGKQSCSFDASNGFFGDPCWGTKKYVEVKYHCEGYDL